MKKIQSAIALLLVACMLNSCGLILGGKVTECQKKKPLAGEPKRQIRPWVLVADIVLCETVVPLVVDLVTGAMYKPCKTGDKPADQPKKK